MYSSIPSLPDREQYVIIKFFNKEGVSRNKIHKRPYKMCRRAVHNWIKMFKEGRASMYDERYSDRPADTLNEETIACVPTLMD